MSEEWRPIPGYEGLYEVSDLGRVRSLPRARTRGKVLKPYVDTRGYPTVNLYLRGNHTSLVHGLVTLAFLGPKPKGQWVRHLNGNPLDARLSNLAYGSWSENMQDQVRHGTHYEASRTACPSGHLYTEDNVRRAPSRPRARYCRQCERARGKGPKAGAA